MTCCGAARLLSTSVRNPRTGFPRAFAERDTRSAKAGPRVEDSEPRSAPDALRRLLQTPR